MWSPAQTVKVSAPARRGTTGRVLRVGTYSVALLALVELIRNADLHGVAGAIGRTGPLSAVVVLPFGIQMLLEAESWRLLLGRLGHRVSWTVSLRATMSAEAVRMCFPGGSAVADGLRPVIFKRQGGVPLGVATSALAVRKLCHIGSEGAFSAIGLALGSSLFARWVKDLGSRGPQLFVAAAVVSLALVGAGVALALLLLHGSVASRAERLLTRLTRGRLFSFLEARRSRYAAFDDSFRALLGCSLLAANAATALAGWLLDGVETFVILALLGAPVAFGEAVLLEACVAVVRAIAFAVPGGLGVQDLSYHTLLRGFVGEPAALGFVLMKRARDVVWIIVGLVLKPI